MAKVLIEYAPDADEEARQLARALTELGHEVVLGLETHAFGQSLGTSLPELAAWVKRFDGTVVIWSEASVGGEFVLAVAREALLMSRLVPARVAHLPEEQLPPLFQKLKTYSVSAGPVSGGLGDDARGISDALFGIQALDVITRAPASAPSPQTPRRVGAAEPAPREDADREQRARAGIGSGVVGGPAVLPSLASATKPKALSPARIEGVGAADGPARPMALAPAPAAQALEIEAGRLVHKIPSKMWLGEAEIVEVRLGREAALGLVSGLVGRGALTEESIPIVETMSVSLYARGGAFDIERQSETTQLVKTDALKGTAFEGSDFGRWTWLVTPKRTGAHQLYVKVSAGLKDSRGVPTTATLPDREFAVSVSVHAGKETMKVLGRFLGVGGGVIAAALVGAITQDLWWPKLKALLAGWGWLG